MDDQEIGSMYEQRILTNSQRRTNFNEAKEQEIKQTNGWHSQDNCSVKDSYGLQLISCKWFYNVKPIVIHSAH